MNSSLTLRPHSFFYLFTALKVLVKSLYSTFKLPMQRNVSSVYFLFRCTPKNELLCLNTGIHFTVNVKKLNLRIPTFQSFICLYKSVKRYIKKKKKKKRGISWTDPSINQLEKQITKHL